MTHRGVEAGANDVILHIAHLSEWERALDDGAYAVSTRGALLEHVGFIHASTPDQVAGVAEFVYSGDPGELVVLVLDEGAIRGDGIEIRYEDPGNGALYPHVYGAIRPRHVRSVERAGWVDGEFLWGDALGAA